VISGWACRLRYLPDGRRQIFTFLLPGDTLGLCERLDPLALTSAVTLTPMETVDISAMAAALRSGAPEHAPLADSLALAARSEEAALLDHMVRLGRQTAYERTAHLLVELCHRLAVVGLGDRRFRLPLTQEILADALGLSLVHVNRTLMQLRRDRLVVLKGSFAELPDLERLALIANYAPQPLHRPDGAAQARVAPVFG
jgi:CRP-like cAMP-binding protein